MGSYSDLLVEEGEEWKRGRMEGEELGRVGEFIPSLLILTFNFGCVKSSEDRWADDCAHLVRSLTRCARSRDHPSPDHPSSDQPSPDDHPSSDHPQGHSCHPLGRQNSVSCRFNSLQTYWYTQSYDDITEFDCQISQGLGFRPKRMALKNDY